MVQRVKKILSEDTPFLGTAVPYVTSVDSGGRPAKTTTILGIYIEEREEFLSELWDINVADLWRHGNITSGCWDSKNRDGSLVCRKRHGRGRLLTSADSVQLAMVGIRLN